MRRVRTPHLFAVSAALIIGLTFVACDTGSRSSPAATSIVVPSLNVLAPQETTTPEPVGTPGDAPSIAPPTGMPPPPPEVTAGYSGSARDLAGFVAAYRTAFQVPELTDDQIAGAGARLCTYLSRQADPSGVVDAALALAEAETNEPGYPRSVWVAAFELATAHFCTEFVFDATGEG